jgi:hypothetical protein
MAGDWIKMRVDLVDDPSVIWMAEQLGLPEPCVVGYLHTIWSWASRQCNDGSVTGVTLASLQRITHCDHVADLMVKVGWLEVLENDGMTVLRFPKWERHNSQSAKQRGLTQLRVAKIRSKSCNGESVTKTLPEQEKRREEIHGPCGKDHINGGEPRKEVHRDDIAHIADWIFQVTKYNGREGGNLWGVAALLETGIGELSQAEVASAANGAALNGKNRAAHFYACLSESVGKRGHNLKDLISRVVIRPNWPKTKPYKDVSNV